MAIEASSYKHFLFGTERAVAAAGAAAAGIAAWHDGRRTAASAAAGGGFIVCCATVVRRHCNCDVAVKICILVFWPLALIY